LNYRLDTVKNLGGLVVGEKWGLVSPGMNCCTRFDYKVLVLNPPNSQVKRR
jgi:hypothetical protein